MPGPLPVEELRDRRVGRQRRQQLDAARPAVADGEHRLADALLLVDLLVHASQAEGSRVERDGLVEVGDGDADVVDAGEHGDARSWRDLVTARTSQDPRV